MRTASAPARQQGVTQVLPALASAVPVRWSEPATATSQETGYFSTFGLNVWEKTTTRSAKNPLPHVSRSTENNSNKQHSCQINAAHTTDKVCKQHSCDKQMLLTNCTSSSCDKQLLHAQLTKCARNHNEVNIR